MDLHVIAHEHDAGAEIYRLEIGLPAYAAVAVLDDEGVPVLDDAGEQVTQPEFAGYADRWDYVFAADDPKWAGRSLEDIAAEQRQIVVDALTEQVNAINAEEARKSAARTAMPGAGEPL